MHSQTISVFTTLIFIMLFNYTAVSKVADLQEFQYNMLNQPFPEWINRLLIWLLPVTEFFVAGLLIFKKFRMYGNYGALILMSAFTVYVGLVLSNFFGRIPCSCGGIISSLTWKDHFAVNLAFLALAIMAVVNEHYHEKKISRDDLP